MKNVLALILSLMLVFACVCAAEAASDDVVSIKILLTSDIHGAIVDSQYSKGDAETIDGTSMTRLYTLIKEQRALNSNTLLIDNGDTLQGTPFTYYYCFFDQSVANPAMVAMRYMGYDVWTLGNHEFNYGMDILQKEISDISAEATETESSVTVLAANYVATGSEDYTPWENAYYVKEFDGVKVGVIGMGNCNVPTWDKPANWEGIDFKTFLNTWQNYADILRNQEGCDIVILSCHSGAGTSHGTLVEAAELENMNGEGLYYDGSYENQIAAVIENTTGIDFVLAGHTHSTGSYTLTNADGAEVTVLHSGTKCQSLGVVDIEFNKTTGTAEYTVNNIDARQTEPDADMVAYLSSYENTVWANYLNETIGYAAGDFVSPANMIEANAFLDLVNEVQLQATGAQISISAPLTNGSGVIIPEGEIKLGLMFNLYVYENWLYNIDMTGSEIKEWLEFAATKYSVDENGAILGGGIYCDTAYGDGVTYEIYVGNEIGDRVRNLTWQGQPMDMDATYQVVINNYRFTGGGHYIENVSTLEPNDESRINFSTQYDMEQGEDLGQVRNLLTQYIRDNGTIEPTVKSEFHVYAGASEN